jgi:hypothetical protein
MRAPKTQELLKQEPKNESSNSESSKNESSELVKMQMRFTNKS